MLFKILKLFGIDVPAQMASLERRVEEAADHVTQVAREAAIIAALAAIAGIATTTAVGIGLIALYRWTADAYGVYAGLEVTAGIMGAIALLFGVGAAIKSKSLSSNKSLSSKEVGVPDASQFESSDVDWRPAEPTTADRPATHREPPVAAIQTSATASASDVIEPVALLLSKIVRYPSLGNPVVDRLIDSLRVTGRGAADETINSAAHVIRNGDRTNLVLVLTGAVFIGWLLSHHAEP